MLSVLPDVYSEAAVAGHRVLVGALQGDAGFGSSTHFAAEDYSFPERTHNVWQRDEELRSHCTQETHHWVLTPQPFLQFLVGTKHFTLNYSLQNFIYWIYCILCTLNMDFYFRWKQVLFIELCDFRAGVGRHSVASALWTWFHPSHYVTPPLLICPQFSANLNFVDLFTHNSQVRPSSGTVSTPRLCPGTGCIKRHPALAYMAARFG